MIACDVNVLLNAQNSALDRHSDYHRWLEEALNGPEPVGVPNLVLSGYLRVVTDPRLFPRALSPDHALRAAEVIRGAPAYVPLEPGPGHWDAFTDLCRTAETRGDRVPDAYLAAIAVEHGCDWVSADRGFARFPRLRWRHPLD